MMVKKIGDHDLLNELGQSPIGALWSARSPEGDALVRVTRVGMHLAEADARRVAEAARIAVGLEHERIVTVVKVVREGQQLAIVHAARSGILVSTLQRKTALQPRAVPVAAALRIAADLCEALAFVHEQANELPVSRVFGGVSPDSALVGDDGVTRLIDTFSASAGTGEAWMHAPRRAAYQSPEHLSGRELSPASDVFSIATIVYEILVRRPLFSGASLAEVKRRMLEPVRRADAVRGVEGEAIPQAIADVLARALRPEPSERHASVLELAQALAAAVPPAAHDAVASMARSLADASGLEPVRLGAAGRPPKPASAEEGSTAPLRGRAKVTGDAVATAPEKTISRAPPSVPASLAASEQAPVRVSLAASDRVVVKGTVAGPASNGAADDASTADSEPVDDTAPTLPFTLKAPPRPEHVPAAALEASGMALEARAPRHARTRRTAIAGASIALAIGALALVSMDRSRKEDSATSSVRASAEQHRTTAPVAAAPQQPAAVALAATSAWTGSPTDATSPSAPAAADASPPVARAPSAPLSKAPARAASPSQTKPASDTSKPSDKYIPNGI